MCALPISSGHRPVVGSAVGPAASHVESRTTSRGVSSTEGLTQSVDECQAFSKLCSSSKAAVQIRGGPTEKLAQSELNTQAGREQIVLSGSSQKMCSP